MLSIAHSVVRELNHISVVAIVGVQVYVVSRVELGLGCCIGAWIPYVVLPGVVWKPNGWLGLWSKCGKGLEIGMCGDMLSILLNGLFGSIFVPRLLLLFPMGVTGVRICSTGEMTVFASTFLASTNFRMGREINSYVSQDGLSIFSMWGRFSRRIYKARLVADLLSRDGSSRASSRLVL